MRADRLLSMMMLLQTRGSMSARELAEKLEVSKRTIYRDVDALSYAGKAGALQDLGLSNTFEDALLKLFSALPSIHRREVTWMQQRVHVDHSRWFQNEEPLVFFPDAQKAVWENRIIECVYQNSDGALVERTLEAYGLVAKNNLWYLVGRKPDGDFRSYRIYRFRSITSTDRLFERDPGFDLAAYWESACRAYEQRVAQDSPPIRATLRADPGLMWYFDSMFVGKYERVKTGEQEDWLTLRVQFDSMADAAAILPGLGGQIEVLAPAALRLEVLRRARAILERHHEG
jgi:predicted DNA-binding transcriptional regulator YafY